MQRLARFFPILWLFSGLWGALPAQDNLYLEHPGRLKRIQILPGDSVRLQISGEDFTYGARIRGARDPWIFFGRDSLKITDVDAFLRRPAPGARYWIAMLQIAATMSALIFPVMILLNRTAVTGYEREDLNQILAIVGGAVVVKLLLRTQRWRKYRLKRKKWRLRVQTPIEKL